MEGECQGEGWRVAEGVSATEKGVQRQGDLVWPVQQGAAPHEEP